MARYTGPKWKISRRENSDIFGSDKWRKRAYPPGQHGASKKGRPSNYAIQFREKQKCKRTFGLLEKQFRNVYKKASKATGNTGTRLMQLLEMRLDNAVYRLGLAKTRNQARQFVTHGHVTVNGAVTSIPSYTLIVGEKVELKSSFAKSDIAHAIQAELKGHKVPEWLHLGEVKSEPTREMMDQEIREQLIVEFYSR